MEISAWLEAITDQSPPGESGGCQLPDLARAQVDNIGQVRQHSRRKRYRASSDSSLLAARKARHRAERSPSARGNTTWHEGGSSSSHGRSDSQSTRRNTRRDPYQRRPRHKTRPDRYEPKLKCKPRKKEPDDERGKRSRRKRRSHGRGDGERTTGLVQSFQLKNGSRSGRLTLRPDHYVGLFKHGRAGPQTGGRGNGLPDLVFNEMKFLKKPLEHQDEPGAAASMQHRNKDGHGAPNDETSTYFKPSNEPRVPEPHNQRRRPAKSDQEKHPRQQPKAGQVMSIAASLEAQNLGSRRQCKSRESQRKQDAATEYLSWSESLPRDVSPARRGLPVAAAIPTEPQYRRPQMEQSPGVVHIAETQKSNLTTKAYAKQGGKKSAGERQRVQSKEFREHFTGDLNDPQGRTPHESSWKFLNLEEQARDTAEQPEVPRTSYRTSDILDVHFPKSSPSHLKCNTLAGPGAEKLSDKENLDPYSSMDELLGRTREALSKLPSLKPWPSHSSRMPLQAVPILELECLQSHDAERIAGPAPEQSWCSPVYGQLTHSDLMPQHARVPVSTMVFRMPSDRASEASREDTTNLLIADNLKNSASCLDQVLLYEDDNEMLDVGLEAEAQYSSIGTGHFMNREPDKAHDGFTHERSGLGSRMSVYGLPAEQEVQQVEHWALAGEECDEFAGFWKPNKLY